MLRACLHHLILLGLILSAPLASAITFNSSDYEVYYGDFNGDGKDGDVYVHGKDQFVLIHGDIAVPILIDGPAGFVYYEDGGSTPHSLNLTNEELAAYLQGSLGSGYFFSDLNGDGLLDLVIQGASGTYILAGSSASSLPTADITHLAPENIDTPQAPTLANDNLVADLEKQNTDKLTTIAANFRVNESGAATYSVPISVPQGTAGVAPLVSLEYSSSSGNGIAGIGWAIGGLAAITRCPQSNFIDGQSKPISWTNEDRYCLNGARLLLESGAYGAAGSTYSTELNPFARVTAVGGSLGSPDYFEVEAKDGSISIYGNDGSADRGAEAAAWAGDTRVSTKVMTWLMSEFRDSVGNQIEYHYREDELGNRIEKIEYAFGAGSSSHARVKFDYEDREDVFQGYMAGYRFRTMTRLTDVTSYEGPAAAESEVHRYALNYENPPSGAEGNYSRLDSISLCASGTCYDEVKTSFDWGSADYSIDTTVDESVSFDNHSVLATYQSADFSGDGKLDTIWLSFKPDGNMLRYQLNAKRSGSSDFHIVTGFSIYGDPIEDPEIKLLDYNLDGRTDFIFEQSLYLAQPSANGNWTFGSGISLSSASQSGAAIGLFPESQFLDVNADGTIDTIHVNVSGSSIEVTAHYLQKDPSVTDSTSNRWYAFSASQTIPVVGDLGGATFVDNYKFGDFNGDGLADLAINTRKMHVFPYDPVPPDYIPFYFNNISIFYQTESGFEFAYDTESWSIGEPGKHIGSSTKDFDVYPVDINADGLTDIASFHPGSGGDADKGGSWHYRLSSGAGFDAASTTIKSFSSTEKNDRFATFTDVNGDSLVDFVWHDKANGQIKRNSWDPAMQNFTDIAYTFRNGALDSEYDSYRVFDQNGDGIVDFHHFDGEEGTLEAYLGAPHEQNWGDYIYGITNSLGVTTHINYGTLVDSHNYTPLLASTREVVTEEICRTLQYSPDYPPVEHCYTSTAAHYDTDQFYTLLNDPYSDLPDDYFSMPLTNTFPAIELAGAVSVVTEVFSSLPNETDPNAMQGVSYHYEQLRAQAGGRGLLGFKRLTTTDLQNGVSTTTRYRQDWPYIGSPIETVSRSAEGNILSRSMSRQAIRGRDSASGTPIKYSTETHHSSRASSVASNGVSAWGPLHVYVDESRDFSYELLNNGASQGAILSNTLHTKEYDNYGNTVSTETSIYDGDSQSSLFSQVTTGNSYLSSYDGQFLGRLSASDVTTYRPSSAAVEDSVTKRAEFTYYGMNDSGVCGSDAGLAGLLCEEKIVESGSTILTTRHHYDGFGNELFTYAYADDDASSGRLSGFARRDDIGRYGTQAYGTVDALAGGSVSTGNNTYNSLAASLGAAVRLVSSIDSRNRFGQATASTSYVDTGAGFQSQAAYTDFGNQYFSASSLGSYALNTVSSDTSLCPTSGVPAAFTTRERTATGAESRTCFDKLGRPLRAIQKGFEGEGSSEWIFTDTVYDDLGRKWRTSDPYYQGSTPYWTENTDFDLRGRAREVLHAYNVIDSSGNETGTRASSQIVHNGATRTITTYNAANQSKVEVFNLAGEVVNVTNKDDVSSTYGYDVFGKLVELNHPGGGKTQVRYNARGLKEWMDDPDKGVWEYKYNGFGDLVCQQDANGQLIINGYDFKGRLVERSGYTGGICESPSGLQNRSYWEYDIADNGVGQLASEYDDKGYRVDYFYDSFGRGSQTNTDIPGDAHIDAETHSARVTYDEHGRVFQSYDAARHGSDFSRGATQNVYDEAGYLWKVVNAHREGGEFADTYYEINDSNARGNVTNASLGNGVTAHAEYYERSGLVKLIRATRAGGLNVLQDLTMKWDTIGNLHSRHDQGHRKSASVERDLLETFSYDDVNQLTGYAVSGDVTHNTNVTYTNDGRGNIQTKDGVSGTYIYHSSKIHQLSSISGRNFSYDDNGNLQNDGSRTFTYTEFDKVKTVSKNGHVTTFDYGTGRNRYKRTDTKNNKTTTTLYLGNVEKVYHHDNTAKWKRNIAGVAQITIDLNGSAITGETTHYLLKDHLGSTTTIADESGNIEQLMAFDPWGARRNIESWNGLAGSEIINFFVENKPITQRGFTGHEMVDEVDIIHMNGRIYDAELARFLQADPFVQAPTEIASLNRYSYVWNNPLNATDPSGFFWEKAALVGFKQSYTKDNSYRFGMVGAAISFDGMVAGDFIGAYLGGKLSRNVHRAIAGNQVASQVYITAVGIVSAVYCQACSIGFTAAAQTEMAYYQNGGDYWAAHRSGGKAAASAAVFYYIGNSFLSSNCASCYNTPGVASSGLTNGAFAGKVLAHAVAGGVMAEMHGGEFRHGFVSAGLSKLATYNGNNYVRGVVQASVVGGTASVLTGGKFANGARTAAYGYIYNEVISGLVEAAQERADPLAYGKINYFDGITAEEMSRLRNMPPNEKLDTLKNMYYSRQRQRLSEFTDNYGKRVNETRSKYHLSQLETNGHVIYRAPLDVNQSATEFIASHASKIIETIPIAGKLGSFRAGQVSYSDKNGLITDVVTQTSTYTVSE